MTNVVTQFASVSIPGRDLGVLEQTHHLVRLSQSRFQSLEGIWGFWNQGRSPSVKPRSRFQSLEGIWGFWNDCDYPGEVTPLPEDRVSIPGRDLGVLEQADSRRNATGCHRFNPWKGFGGFGTFLRCAEGGAFPPFQSLEGIWGFWNRLLTVANPSTKDVSIPGRDLGVLERVLPRRVSPCGQVSIPGRDLGVLEQKSLAVLSSSSKVSIPGRDLGVLEQEANPSP